MIKVNYQMSPVIIFWLNILKGTAKARTAVDLLRLNTLRGTKTAFFNLQKVRQVPLSFSYGSPPPQVFICIDLPIIRAREQATREL